MSFDILAICGEALLRMQFDLRESSFRHAHPDASFLVIAHRDGHPVGRIALDWDAGDGCHGVDLAVHPDTRRGAAGLFAMRAWTTTLDRLGLAATLDVIASNPARKLYRRLGFVETGPDTGGSLPMKRAARPV